MATMTIPAKDALRIEFEPGARPGRYHLVIEAERPIRAYAVDERGLDQYDDPDAPTFSSLAGADVDAKEHDLRLHVPRGKPWFLLLVNLQGKPSAVHWRFV